MLPILRDELATHKADSARTGPDDPVFPTSTSGLRDKDNLRMRVLAPVLRTTPTGTMASDTSL